MKKHLETKYNAQSVEQGVYSTWIKEGYFTAGDKTKAPFTIVIPPPNVTGRLHLGHAWDTSLQDIIARFKRMQGYDMLWLPGMDHAGIATQAKVDARLKEQGISRYDLGREVYLEKAWEWKEEYAAFIREQWAKMGLSLDYTRERFTLDEGLNQAVNKVFVSLYNEGLIYQGERIINWDPEAKTALSNIEVIHKEVEGAFYTFKYDVVETKETLLVATTRPETMFGDVAVFIHPDDPRFTHLHGKHVINPANHEVMPILTDTYIDIEFGTGAMKCTPAHDPNDFALADKYHLTRPICMHPDGKMNALAGEYDGLDRFECRAKLTQRITDEGHTHKVEKHIHQVGHSERTDVIVEPYLSKQWFVRMQPLAKAVLDAQMGEDKIEFIPERFETTFKHWLENIEDWCISRQLWWGHRIPVWTQLETGELYVSENAPEDIENYRQDEDVLDTWFSSALWPFSTLGWPEESDDFNRYYPTNVLVTGYDIIFFWAARMAFQAKHFTGRAPFHQTLIHGLIRDADGRKMSKSLGNGVDPMDVIDQYGADALRFFLTTNSAPGLDLRYSPEKVESSWNFINKLWNASRFVLMNCEEDFKPSEIKTEDLSAIDLWIIERFDETLEKVTSAMEKYDFALAGGFLYDFVWSDYCSWYIELAKSNLNSSDEKVKRGTQNTLVNLLRDILKLCHPSMPFVTEKLFESFEEGALCLTTWPSAYRFNQEETMKEINQLISLISALRSLKTEFNLKPSTPLNIVLETAQFKHQDHLEKMVKTSVVSTILEDTLQRAYEGGSFSIASSSLIDPIAEKASLEKEKARLENEIKRSESMLKNERFVASAPADKLKIEQDKFDEYKRQYELCLSSLKKLEVKA